ncbi:MAG TPA: TetR family transcriptional regulator [Pseudonocardiaceae bacterium]|jgi:AcrR family transcriptional regulator|nr:TetR family transcriptional regulator [Pseudonocardiaceae bacterium]
MPDLTGPVGKREQNKMATRKAIEDAAKRLFDERGYENVTVREIASSAGITERTFFRYFGGKAELIVEDVLTWLPALQHLVRSQPPDMPPLTALRTAFLALQQYNENATGPTFMTLFSEGPPAPQIAATRRWRWFTAVMNALVEALSDRVEATEGHKPDDDTRYRIEVIVWATVAVFRTALVRQWQLRSTGRTAPTVAELVEEGFSQLR